jgi:hypothetical protein
MQRCESLSSAQLRTQNPSLEQEVNDERNGVETKSWSRVGKFAAVSYG